MALLCNNVSHWLCAILESALPWPKLLIIHSLICSTLLSSRCRHVDGPSGNSSFLFTILTGPPVGFYHPRGVVPQTEAGVSWTLKWKWTWPLPQMHHWYRCQRMPVCNSLPWWRGQMETLSTSLALCEGKPQVDSPHKGQWCWALTVSAKYVSLPDMSDVCLTFTMQFYNGLHSIVRQMADVSLPHFAYTALEFTLICAWTNGCAKNQDASDLRCHRAHYDVTVM